MEPLPNWRSICARAADNARSFPGCCLRFLTNLVVFVPWSLPRLQCKYFEYLYRTFSATTVYAFSSLVQWFSVVFVTTIEFLTTP
ncbi:MAG: hypothetical protein CM15mP120_22730 [Pseudomonadota bacterium]|nr:MAG: hypothetical protein CM15mP120_22730 [Pseudomonadota bacterium]